MHAAFILQNMGKLQVKNATAEVKQFFRKLASNLLTTKEVKQDIYGHIFCSIIGDSFNSDFIQEHSQMNLLNVDLKFNYAMTILNKMQMLKSKKEQGRQITKQTFLRKLVSFSFYRGVSFGQVLLMHEKALEEMHFVVEKRDYLPDNLKKSQYFEFLLREMKQTSFENMRKQGEMTKSNNTEKKLPQINSEQLNLSHAESVQSSEDRNNKSIRSHQSSRRNSPSRMSNQPELAPKTDSVPGAEDQLDRHQPLASETDQVGMFGRFKGMFGRIKDEAMTYVVSKDEDEKRGSYGEREEKNQTQEEERHEQPEITQQYLEEIEPPQEQEAPKKDQR